MTNKHAEFHNPNNVPVEELTLSVSNSGVVQQIKALDPYWIEQRELILYEKPPTGNSVIKGSVEVWKNKMEVYMENLKWLLQLEHHRFWSTILYHPQCMDMLISFLQEASPPYMPPYESREVQRLYEEIRRLVLVALSRLVTNKESKSRWMSKQYMGDLLYDKFVLSVPVLWDACVVYGVDNARHVARLIDAAFELQPRYEGDVEHAVAFVNEVLKYIIHQVNKDYDSVEPPNLPETFKGFSDIRRPAADSRGHDDISFDMLRDLVLHLLDTAVTLRVFVEAYPKAAHILKKKNFILSIAQLYEYGIPQLYEKLEELGERSAASAKVEGYLDSARAELIDLFKEVLAVYKNCIFSGEGSVATHVEGYLALVMDALSERLFVRDYHACYPLHEDLEMLRQAYPDIDTVKTDFILQAIYSNIDEPVPEELLGSNTEVLTNGHIGQVEPVENGAEQSPDVGIPDNVREESLISEVKDILPHLGDGFILKCLQHYGFNSERVINSLLEGTLAESLKGLDQSLPLIPEDTLDKKFLETGVARLNVFDGDQFDVMTRDDVDLSRIHRGKRRSKYKDLGDMLDDKTEVRRRIDIYSKYNMVCDEQNMYSDEYDDTYDTDGAGVAPAADGEDPRRPFVTPRALLTARQEQEQEDVSEEEGEPSEQAEEEKAGSSRSRMEFCMNPEEVRARREAAQAARRGKTGYRPPPARNTDVTGRPKGQGQEKEVLHNRDKKEKHKSSRGNHSRRQGAQWKRSQGMMPS